MTPRSRESPGAPARERALLLLELGIVPVPVRPRSKRAIPKGWQHRTAAGARDSLEEDFAQPDLNVGALLGEPSGGLADIDLDCPEAVRLAPRFLPPTATFGRASSPQSHWIYYARHIKSRAFRTPAAPGAVAKTLAEIRGERRMTVFPGSVHPSGEEIAWTDGETPIAAVSPADLSLAVAMLAVAALLARDGMSDDDAEAAARAGPEWCGEHASLAAKWTGEAAGAKRANKGATGGEDRRGAASPPAQRSSGEFEEAAANFNRDHRREWPAGNGKCPFCGHRGCFGRLPDSPDRWVCFSASHAGPGIPGDGCFHGDALDYEAHLAGAGRRELLESTGYLRKEHAEFHTDLGLAIAIAAEFGRDIRHCAMLGQWFVWDGGIWKPDASQELVRIASRIARKRTLEAESARDPYILRAAKRQEQQPRIAGALKLAEAMRGIAVAPEQMDADPWLLACRNGTLDLRTGKLRPSSRDDLITRRVPHDFDPRAKAPRFMRFLDEVALGRPDLIAFIRRWAGYCLTAETREHVLAMFIGTGCNGKSVLVEALMHAMGPDLAGPAPPGLLLVQKSDRHPTELMDLRGRRLVVSNEVPAASTLNEERVKGLTGGDTIKARGMRQDFTSFKPTHKLVLCANHMPSVRDRSEGFWRRIRVVPFDACFRGREDRGLADALREEAPGILAWMVEGCLEWQREGLGEPEPVAARTREYRTDSDGVGQWADDRGERGDSLREAAAKELLDDYNAFAESNGFRALSSNVFARELKAAGWTRRKSRGGMLWSAPEPAAQAGTCAAAGGPGDFVEAEL